jgi:hypothetical protein
MKVAELVKSASAANARVFEKVDEKTAVSIANAIVAEILDQVEAVEEGRLTISGLGTFIVKLIDSVPPGGAKQKRVIFRPVK